MTYIELSDSEIQAQLSKLPGWQLQNGNLSKQFHFADFIAAWGFMSQVALLAESQNHHPNWRNVYNRVEIELFTHDAHGITQKDLELARLIEQTLK